MLVKCYCCCTQAPPVQAASFWESGAVNAGTTGVSDRDWCVYMVCMADTDFLILCVRVFVVMGDRLVVPGCSALK